jgi:hypothetical protein
MNGTAHHTKGGLTKKQLKYNKHGRIVSKKASMKAKKANRLAKAGFIPKKGVFKLFKKGDGKKTRKMRGGMPLGGVPYGSSISATAYDGRGVGTSGNALQFVAGNAA